MKTIRYRFWATWVIGVSFLCMSVQRASAESQWMGSPVAGLPSCGSACTVGSTSFTTSGDTTWTQNVKNGDIFVWAVLIGAGGGAGGCGADGENGGGGGGAGEVKWYYPIGHVPYNTVLDVHVGTKGNGGDSTNNYVGQNGEDSYVQYTGFDIVRALGGSGEARGITAGVALGGNGAVAEETDGNPVTGCGSASDAATPGDLFGITFDGAGGGCGAGTALNSHGGKACWYPSGSYVCKTTTYGTGCYGGGGGATMYGTGGNGAGTGCTRSAGTVGGGGGGGNTCTSANPTRSGADGGRGEVRLYWVY